MSKHKYIITLITSILLILVFRSLDTYTVGKPCNIEVLDKIMTNAAYRTSAQFLLIVKDNDGKVFDLNVSPSTYSQTKIGDYKTFIISEQDREITPKGFLIHVLPTLIMIGTAGASLVVILINLKTIEREYEI